MKKILVPVDFNTLSNAALEYAARLATRTGAELIVVYGDTFDPPAEFTAVHLDTLVAAIAQSRRNTKDELERYAHEHVPETIAMRTELREALPVDAILKAIEEHQPDLVVMGTHGRGALARLIMGSVTQAVLAATTAPILAIHRVDTIQAAGDVVAVTDNASAGVAEHLGLSAENITPAEARHSRLPVLHAPRRAVTPPGR
jgi:nucleotide-binding universal stress UspA family protein